MVQRIRTGLTGDDRGASALEYAGLVALAALLVSALVASGLIGGVAKGTRTAVCRIVTPGESCAPQGGGGANGGGTEPAQRSPDRRGNPVAGFARGLWATVTHYGPDGQPISDETPRQTVEFLKGMGEGAVDTVRDTLDLVLHPGKAVSRTVRSIQDRNRPYIERLRRQWRNGDYVGAVTTFGKAFLDNWWNEPSGLGGAANSLVDDKAREYWNNGHPGKAVGRVFTNIGLFIDPGAWALKLGPLSKVARAAETAGKVARGGRLAEAARAAEEAAGRAERAAGRGDLATARREAAQARRKADEAKKEARRRGCRAASLGPLHLGGRFAAPLKPKRKQPTNPCQAAKTAEQNADKAEKAARQYVPAPTELDPKLFPNLHRAKRKTPVQGGRSLRRRWKDDKGNIYEWDSMHGTVEKYDKRGKPLAECDPETGKVTKSTKGHHPVEP